MKILSFLITTFLCFSFKAALAQNVAPYFSDLNCLNRLKQITFINDDNGTESLRTSIIPAVQSEPLGFYVVTAAQATFYPITSSPITSTMTDHVMMNVYQLVVSIDGSLLYFRYWASQTDQNNAFVAISSQTPLEESPADSSYERPVGISNLQATVVTNRLRQSIAVSIRNRIRQFPSTLAAARLFRHPPNLADTVCQDYYDAYNACGRVEVTSIQALLQQGLARVKSEGCTNIH